jgi:hypothetical protein
MNFNFHGIFTKNEVYSKHLRKILVRTLPRRTSYPEKKPFGTAEFAFQGKIGRANAYYARISFHLSQFLYHLAY